MTYTHLNFKNKLIRYSLYFVFIILVIGLNLMLDYSIDNNCKMKEIALAYSIEGEIIAIFEDKTDHLNPKVKIQTEKGQIYNFDCGYEKSGFYDMVRIGDFLHKESNTLFLKIRRKNNESTLFWELRYDCNE